MPLQISVCALCRSSHTLFVSIHCDGTETRRCHTSNRGEAREEEAILSA